MLTIDLATFNERTLVIGQRTYHIRLFKFVSSLLPFCSMW